jgi:2-(1,2-epoxy-1,2-dihydrophenyl)acetyl-CoA isomerase
LTVISQQRVTLTVADGVATLRLARPEGHNSIDAAMVDGLRSALTACGENAGVRALLIAADGPSFTVGGDLRYLAANLERLADELGDMIDQFHDVLGRLAAMPVPVVCAVQGAAAGGGLGLVWCADVVIAAEDARLVSAFAQVGVSGDGGSTWHLPRLVGMRRAMEFTLEGRVLSAAEALEWGLVTRVVPLDRLEEEAQATARRLAEGPTFAYGHMRRLLRTSLSATFEEQLAAERAAMIECGGTADAAEAITAFNARRRPRFEGR